MQILGMQILIKIMFPSYVCLPCFSLERMHVYMRRGYMYEHVEVRGWYQVSSSIVLCLLCWERISPWSQSWPIPPVQLTILVWGSHNSAPRHCDYHSYYVFPAFMSALRMQTEALKLNTASALPAEASAAWGTWLLMCLLQFVVFSSEK